MEQSLLSRKITRRCVVVGSSGSGSSGMGLEHADDNYRPEPTLCQMSVGPSPTPRNDAHFCEGEQTRKKVSGEDVTASPGRGV